MAAIATGHRATAIGVAVLFIIATAAAVTSAFLTDAMIAETNNLAQFAAQRHSVATSVVFMLIAAAVTPGIPLLLFPIFRKHSLWMALSFLVARSFEAVFFFFSAVLMLVLIALANASAASEEAVQNLAALEVVVKSAQQNAFLLGPVIIFSVSAILLSVVLYQTRLVPRWLSVWKFLGALLLLWQGLSVIYEAALPVPEAMITMPIAINEMVFAVWLIFVGFNTEAIARLDETSHS